MCEKINVVELIQLSQEDLNKIVIKDKRDKHAVTLMQWKNNLYFNDNENKLDRKVYIDWAESDEDMVGVLITSPTSELPIVAKAKIIKELSETVNKLPDNTKDMNSIKTGISNYVESVVDEFSKDWGL